MTMNSKRHIYFAQISDKFGQNLYLPYSAGIIAANSFADKTIEENYVLKDFIFEREIVDRVIERLDNPFVFAMSTYLWNFEYSKSLAERIKQAFPSCIIVFGGHNVSVKSSEILEENTSVDILIHGEGEESFKRLLMALIDPNGSSLNMIPNISFREHSGKIVKTVEEPQHDIKHLPSVYLNGLFDSIIQKGKFIYSAILETNRGCPFGCAYCDYGSMDLYGKKIRSFPIERVKTEIEWFAKNKIEFIFCADANFGIMKRDLEIADYLISIHEKYGYPKFFRTCYTKNKVNAVYEINKKLNGSGMSRGGTVSFQSLNADALNNIGRKNIPLPQFSKLMALYMSSQTPVYSELIIGLPGETYESFCDGIDALMRNGQHTGIFVYNCEILPNSIIGGGYSEYRKRYAIEGLKTPAVRLHSERDDSEISEYDHIIVKTYSMSKEDWIRMNLFSTTIQALHSLGLTQKISIYLFHTVGLSYVNFYNGLIDYVKQRPGSLLNNVFGDIHRLIYDVLYNGKSLEYRSERFGTISWSLDEGMFLQYVEQLNIFYEETKDYLKASKIYSDITEELIVYQKCVITAPYIDSFTVDFNYDFNNYFNNGCKNLFTVKNRINVNYPEKYDNIKEYAEKIVWYGRKSWKMINQNFVVEY